MANVWDADIAIDATLAARLIEVQFPELSPLVIELLGAGWDNAAFQVNDAFVFRFPRRQFAIQFMEREARVLPVIAPSLPLPIPVPQFIGTPTEAYPYPFSGYRLIRGSTACRISWTEAERCRIAASLAYFLSALHRLPIDAATRSWAPGDEIARTNLQKRFQVMQERSATINAASLTHSQRDNVLAVGEKLATTPPWSSPACWVHGDLYARHLLSDESHRLCGVIDWGDVHLGDPALDISIAFSFLPPEGRALFRRAYGEIDEATWDRARFRALHYGIVLLAYGQSVGDEAIASAGAYALESAIR